MRTAPILGHTGKPSAALRTEAPSSYLLINASANVSALVTVRVKRVRALTNSRTPTIQLSSETYGKR